MGMAMMFPEDRLEELTDEFIKMENHDKHISRVTDFFIGFFCLPFMWFVTITSVLLITKPSSISDGMAILYLALITGLYYVLNQKTIFVFEKQESIRYKILGLTIFFILLFATLLSHD